MKKYKWWLLIAVWIIIIFMFSHMDGVSSANASKGIINLIFENLFEIIGLNVSEEKIIEITNNLNYPLRKIMHVLVYLVLAYLVINVLKKSNFSNKKIYIVTFLICYTYSCIDELHQLFVGRTGQFMDTVIDSIGIFIVIIIHYCRNKQKLL